jgi:hypothetical protein
LLLDKGVERKVDSLARINLVGDAHKIFLDIMVLLSIEKHAFQYFCDFVDAEPFVFLLLLSLLLLASVLHVVHILVLGRQLLVDNLDQKRRIFGDFPELFT